VALGSDIRAGGPRRLQGPVKYKRATWFMDETYVRIAGPGCTCSALSMTAARRSISAFQKPGTAKLQNASCRWLSRIQTTGRHTSYLWTGIVATGLPSGELKAEGEIRPACRHRCRQYGNNRIESDHRHVKRRLRAMQGPRTRQTGMGGDSGNRSSTDDQKGTGSGNHLP
jgi:hypothetical protein